MSTIRPTKMPEPWTYRVATQLYEGIPNGVATKASSMASRLGAKAPTAEGIGNFLKQQFNNDFHEFAKAEVGGWFKTLIAEPPRGALLFLLYPCTVGPRLYRAYQRGKKENDYREMGDVLRRDLTAITFFVFALSPIVKGLSGFVQKISKVKLLSSSDQALKYSQFRNYELDTVPALKAILAEENGQGLKNAINSLSTHGLEEGSPLAKAIGTIKTSVAGLVDNYEKALKKLKDPKLALAAVDGQAQDVIQHLKDAEGLRAKLLEQAEQSGTKGLVNAAKGLQGEFTGALKKYAKVRRLPTDLISFLAVVGLIGWFPVWFNSVWNKRQFEKEKAAQEAAQASQPPAQPMPFNSFRSHASYPPLQPLNYGMRPYGANPFARQ